MSKSIKNAGRMSCLGAGPTLPSWRGEGGAASCEAAGPEEPVGDLLEYYVEDFFGPRTTQMVGN